MAALGNTMVRQHSGCHV